MSKVLTLKQKRFVRAIPTARSATEAAIKAGYAEKSARVLAHENLENPNIRQAIAMISDKAGLDDSSIAKDLKAIISRGVESNSATASDSLRGLEMVLRLKDRFPVSKQIEASLDIRAELKAKSVDELRVQLKALESRAAEL